MFGGVPTRYFCQTKSTLALRAFEDGVVVYDEADGSLHALSPVAGDVLGHLIRHAERLSDVDLARLVLQDEPEATDLEHIGNLLSGLVDLGLVEQAAT